MTTWLRDDNGNKCSVDALRRLTAEPRDQCILWTGFTDPKGYGRVWFKKRYALAHRASYELNCGPIARGLCVCHRCDNPSCVNPSHLFVASQDENIRDRNTKGRTARGERASHSKLSERDVKAIRGDHRSTRVIAVEYGIASSSVSGIKQRKYWGHVR